ncbi:hypothetical protein C5167_011488 [Papaver somniferum]|uniref:Uncharacterized protein n=1 Tax=Papaver somniferum TaxID=3469 RepID=A0A4Y7K738_PAPSO|nr:hypothetical protein C5167_011488 [Papaver somniferum]
MVKKNAQQVKKKDELLCTMIKNTPNGKIVDFMFAIT